MSVTTKPTDRWVVLYPDCDRWWLCPRCGKGVKNVLNREDDAPNAKWCAATQTFSAKCLHCGLDDSGWSIMEHAAKRGLQVRELHFNPKEIEELIDPLDGTSRFVWRIPLQLQDRVAQGDPLLWQLWPVDLLRCALRRKDFQFDPDKLVCITRTVAME